MLRWSTKHERSRPGSQSEANNAYAPASSADGLLDDQAAKLRMEDVDSGITNGLSMQDFDQWLDLFVEPINPSDGGVGPIPACWRLDWLSTPENGARTEGGSSDLSESVTGPCQQTGSHLNNVLQNSAAIAPAIIDMTTNLVEFWFKDICPMVSSFDSITNFNRELPARTWSTSEAVFYTVQTMSAAYLSTTAPKIKVELPRLATQAIAAIKKATRSVKASSTSKITPDLMFAVIGMGTSSHWTTSTMDLTWFNETQELLYRWGSNLTQSEIILHSYFKHAWIYWKMLLSAANSEFSNDNLELRRRKAREAIREAVHVNHHTAQQDQPLSTDTYRSLPGTRPSTWCGVSAEVIDLFGQVLSLCRSARARQSRAGNLTVDTAYNVLCDVKVASELQAELEGIDLQIPLSMDELQGFQVITWDESTPISHLIHTAEAYRLAGLLHLYLTFNDLEVRPAIGSEFAWVNSPSGATSGNTSRSQKLIALATSISAILERIPVESCSRSIHPILYLSAAAGLRFETESPSLCSGGESSEMESIIDMSAFLNEPNAEFINTGLLRQDMDPGDSPPDQFVHTPAPSQNHHQPLNISSSSLAIAKARRFTSLRMSILQHCLPPRPLEVMSNLIKKIWARYDESEDVHWLDVMMDSGLQTLFK